MLRRLGIPHLHGAHDLDAEDLLGEVQVVRDRERSSTVELAVTVHRHDRRAARDEVLVRVLIRAPVARDIDHQPTHTAAGHDVRHHRPATRLTAASICGTSFRHCAVTSRASFGQRRPSLADRASGLMLLATFPRSDWTVNRSAAACFHSESVPIRTECERLALGEVGAA
ncbi:hypothetical protein [Clavibacter michiganensis]|uniref:Uncharacterized protein n=1 Tax=Clavibacter michiganensis subsp. insidiosus TaxID=33014 RepID=A0A399MYD5_9MICO|nr:hypothetical protein [Clavibacter michiganensis]RII86853.1 hypothetical protein DZF92_09070 [Clavibacter michiganensis subsp. insidiosus]RIJ45043.1 hypothetical protein DZF93_00435 [Clavibacter michiganensis subsp. insidiosus]